MPLPNIGNLNAPVTSRGELCNEEEPQHTDPSLPGVEAFHIQR